MEVDVLVCASRGRGEGWVQQFEIGGTVSNTITSVTKDNLLLLEYNEPTRFNKGKVDAEWRHSFLS